MELPDIPRWEGEPRELYPPPPSVEESEERNPRTAYELAWVLEEAGLYDPDFLASIRL